MYSSSFVLQCFAALALLLSVSGARSDAFRQLGRKGGCCEEYRVDYNQCCVNGERNTEAGCPYWWGHKCAKGLDGYLAYSQCTECSPSAEETAMEPAVEAGAEPVAETETTNALSNLEQSNLQLSAVTPSGLSTRDWVLVGIALLFVVAILVVAAKKIACRRQQSEANETDSKGSNDTSLEDIEVSVPEEASAP